MYIFVANVWQTSLELYGCIISFPHVNTALLKQTDKTTVCVNLFRSSSLKEERTGGEGRIYTKILREYEIFKVASRPSQCLKSYSAFERTVHVLRGIILHL